MNRFLTLTLVLVVAATALPATPLTDDVAASSHAVRPGDQMETSVGFCTVNFVFDGVGAQAGEVYFGTAAHCVSQVGQSVTVAGNSGFATVAYIHSGPELADDFAFMRVDSAQVHRVQADVKGHDGSPTGVATPGDTSLGDVVQMSGYGTVFNIHQITRENRVGVLWSHSTDHYIIDAPIIFGDSGGPLLHEPTGKALGIVSAIVAGCCSGPGAWNEGPTVQGMQDSAAANGFTVQLRTA